MIEFDLFDPCECQIFWRKSSKVSWRIKAVRMNNTQKHMSCKIKPKDKNTAVTVYSWDEFWKYSGWQTIPSISDKICNALAAASVSADLVLCHPICMETFTLLGERGTYLRLRHKKAHSVACSKSHISFHPFSYLFLDRKQRPQWRYNLRMPILGCKS
jgi:hypothetical protein